MSVGRAPSRLDARLDSLGHVLRDMRLVVPAFQRPFSWSGEQVEAYWNDLEAARSQGQREYFLGTIVLAPAEHSGTWTVIDGQQRRSDAI
jgi:uncharacterized protein with ParB-like and HNH nuclease domain